MLRQHARVRDCKEKCRLKVFRRNLTKIKMGKMKGKDLSDFIQLMNRYGSEKEPLSVYY